MGWLKHRNSDSIENAHAERLGLLRMRLLTWKTGWDEEMLDFWGGLGFPEAERWRQ